MSAPVVSWAGPAEAAAQALRRGSEHAALGRPQEACLEFRRVEEMARAARYWIEDQRLVDGHRDLVRSLQTLGRGGD